MLRKLAWIFTIVAVIYGLGRVYYRSTDDFRVGSISYDFPHRPEWDPKPLSLEEQVVLNAVLGQHFDYLGKGAQAYAFLSEDDRYVIKFFKFKHLKPSWFLSYLPNWQVFAEFRQSELARKQKKFDNVFDGYKTAYDLHKEESGLFFIHLNNSDNLHKKVSITDKIGWDRELELDQLIFVIQEKGKTLRMVMHELLKKGDTTTAKQRVRQIFDLYMSEYHKGIYDRDHGVMHNTGFVGTKPIHLDVGKMSREEKMKLREYHQPDLEKVIAKINLWVFEHYPTYYQEMVADMESKLTEIFQEQYVIPKLRA